jgi:hypothetical protein
VYTAEAVGLTANTAPLAPVFHKYAVTPLPEACKFADLPGHTFAGIEKALMMGAGFTFKVTTPF